MTTALPLRSRLRVSPFRSRLDDYLVSLARGDLLGAARAHFAPDIRLFDNGAVAAEGLEGVLRKLHPVARRFTMLRGTVDGLVCDRVGETAEFSCRFDGVEVDGRFFRETVSFRQRWHLGRIVEEEQWRGAAAFAQTSGHASAGAHASAGQGLGLPASLSSAAARSAPASSACGQGAAA
ncbi:hypothetical protein [Stappia sp. WLB 29]|uniref:hypothetical protein n=1 Tax=Stappia sp. WLB 29 TaxID=2925220 RepID=UPI0020BE0E92|nr:hypothetical protein [Stappia sp. WLB 29]